jgi:hypothetical protein
MQDLVADDIAPGVQLSTMMADILEEASSLHSLSLANNHLDDTAAANIMRALASNGEVQLTQLDLSGNNLLAPVSTSIPVASCSDHLPPSGCWLAGLRTFCLKSSGRRSATAGHRCALLAATGSKSEREYSCA